MNYLPKEFCKNLFELGLDPSTASMVWTTDMADDFFEYPVMDFRLKTFDIKSNIPCWTLADLLDLLPEYIQTGEGLVNRYELLIRKNPYQIAYGNDRGLSEEWHDFINTLQSDKLAYCAYSMVMWLIDRGFIKTERK